MDKRDIDNLNKTADKANDLAQALANLSKEKLTSSESEITVFHRQVTVTTEYTLVDRNRNSDSGAKNEERREHNNPSDSNTEKGNRGTQKFQTGSYNEYKNNTGTSSDKKASESDITTARDDRSTTRDDKFVTRDNRSATRDDRSAIRDDGTATRDDRSTARDDKFVTRDDRGATRDDRGATRDDRNATRDDKFVTRDNRSASRDDKFTPKDDKPVTEKSVVKNSGAELAHSTVADGQVEILATTTVTMIDRESRYTVDSGVHNPRHVNMDMTGIANAAVEAVRSTVDESDAVRGKKELEKYGALFGVGTAGRYTIKKEIERSLYGENAPDRVKAERLNNIIEKKDGGRYVTGETRTGNLIKDYESSKRAIEKTLSEYKINASQYTIKDIDEALKTGIAGSKEKGVILTNDTKELLEELKRLKSHEGQISQFKSAKGGLKNTAKAWVTTALQDSDAYQGYKTVKGFKTAAKAGSTLTRVGIGTGANLAATSTQLVANVGSFATQGATKLGGEIYKHAVGVNSDKARRWTLKHARDREKFRVQRKLINDKATMVRSSSARFQKRGVMGDAKAIFARTPIGKKYAEWKKLQKKKFMSSKFGKGLAGMRAGANKAGMALNKITAPFMKPFKLVNAIQQAIQKLAISLAGYLLVMIIVIIVVLSITSLFVVDNVGSSEDGEIEYGQEAVDYVWEKQLELKSYLQTGKMNDKYNPIPEAWKTERGNIEKDIASIEGNSQTTQEAGDGQSGENSADNSNGTGTNTGEATTGNGAGTNTGEANAENATDTAGGSSDGAVEDATAETAETSATVSADYGILDEKAFQKAVLACACAMIKEDSPKKIFLSYCKAVGDEIFNTATFTRTVAGSNITVVIGLNVDISILKSAALRAINSNEDFLNYALDYNDDEQVTEDDFDEDYAALILDMDEETLLEAADITLHGDAADVILEADIEALILQIKENYLAMFNQELPANRESLIRSALYCVGKATYKMGGGHATLTDVPNTPVPSQLDCSGFVSYALAHSGTDATHIVRTATGFASAYTDVSANFNGKYDQLHPGTIIVKNKNSAHQEGDKWVYNGNGESNHVVIFIGYASPEGEENPRPCIVECTTSGGISGVQITREERVNYIAGKYLYARDPFQ